LVRGRTPLSGLQLGDPLRAAHLELSDVRIVADDVSWTIGSPAIHGLNLERYDTTGIGPMQFSALSMRIAAALSVRKFQKKQAVYVAPVTGDGFAISAFTVENFDRGRIGSMMLAGLEATPKAAAAPAFTLAEFKVAGLDLTRPLKVL